MAKKTKPQSKNRLSRGQINPIVVTSLLLIVVICLAGWVYVDNRNAMAPEELPEEFPTELELNDAPPYDPADSTLDALPTYQPE